ncbi:N-acyl amino acid synthase FeeM domain-containing protein [Nitrosovibrio sp. Nv4]|uniref:N-acyl amino acid synthase FeeM domain-containing protein n=1 Tax=Nitrosovibrio sp. Nv4 TaxID=1945880 RepID=UPI000BD168A3|nr:long-chain N-acyl amino acid synthase [Nitrosovibrio sp. Nv4]SOD40596.1 hypothetical protein SAMN06298226_0870 [Nitrosovibrio sp. Nv4]
MNSYSNKNQSLFPAGKSPDYDLRLTNSIDQSLYETRTNYVLRRSDYSIRLADSPIQRSQASMLIKRMYSCRGYHVENDVAVIAPHDPRRLTLEATIGERLAGTVTLGLDSNDGLLADELYKEEISIFRTKNRSVCELSKLAVDPRYSSKEILGSLFHLAYIYGRNIHNATDLFIEVNPRHAGFYQRMLGLCQIGEERICRRVYAPAVLMHLELEYVDAKIASLANSCKSKEKSLYRYFLPQHEEEGLADTLRGHIN